MIGRNLEEAARWLEQARYDLNAARWNLQGPFWYEACFLAQQAGEKALKAFLFAVGERGVIGPSLLELGRWCGQHDPDFQVLGHEYRVLGRYYITTRYPNGVPSGIPADHFDERDAQEAIAFAQRIQDLVRTKWADLKKAEATGDPEA